MRFRLFGHHEVESVLEEMDVDLSGKSGKASYRTYYEDAWNRLKKDKSAMFWLVVIIILIITAIFAPLLAPYPESYQDTSAYLQPSSREHLLGTDEMGRDILSRIIYGARVSLSVGLIAEAVSLVIGVTLGAIAGFFGGTVDNIISRLIEIFASFPRILFAIAIMFILGEGLINVFVAIGFVGWTGTARVIRSQIIQLKEKQYVEAAVTSGASKFRIIFKHLLPNTLSTIIVMATMDIPGNIMYEASLSFLGLGVQPPQSSWGGLINSSRKFMRMMPSYSIYPGLAIMITVLAFNVFGDALRDALDPQLKNN